MEFRHESWDVPEVASRLRDAGVSLAAADIEIGEAMEVPVSAPFAYVRLRKTPPYSEEEIQKAGRLLKRLSEQVGEIYIYAKHDDVGVAPDQVKRIEAAAAT
jgi:uncharacterized protein YecE (DUF72 family)